MCELTSSRRTVQQRYRSDYTLPKNMNHLPGTVLKDIDGNVRKCITLRSTGNTSYSSTYLEIIKHRDCLFIPG